MFWLIVYRLGERMAMMLPPGVADSLARAIARTAFALRVPARARLERNLRRLVPPDSAAGHARAGVGQVEGIARSAFERFALTVTDVLRLGRQSPAALARAIEVRGAEHVEAAIATGRGVIVLSAHAGNWEWGAAFLASRGIRLRIAARPQASRPLEAFFARRRRRWGVTRLRGRPLWITAGRALRRGQWVALMGDRPASASGARHASTGGSVCAWAAALARRTGAIVLPAVMLRLPDGRYAACFDDPLTPDDCRRGGYRDAMRRHLASHPDQWLAFEPLPEGLA